MKRGDVIGGYTITTDPTNDNAGKCIWAFAERGTSRFFIKEFIELKRPRPESMGSPAAKHALLEICERFEERHRSVIAKIDPSDLDAGNLVVALDFFHEGTKYYKVTARLDHDSEAQPHELSSDQKSVLLGTLADSLALLHRLGVVHGDLKPQNVLLYRPHGSDLFTAKLIDFDDAYLSGKPPERDVIAGDALYGAPEFLRYMQDDDRVPASQLTTAVDMFAFGLLVHTYLTGSLPTYDEQFSSPAECVNAGHRLRLNDRLNPQLSVMLNGLISRDPNSRPAIGAALRILENSSALTLLDAAEPDSYRSPASRLRFNRGGVPRRGAVVPSVEEQEVNGESASTDQPEIPRRSRVRINFKNQNK